jgi:hypothetical protein
MWKCNKLRQEILNRVKELGLWCLTPLSLIQKFISVILWKSVLLVETIGVPRGN